MGPHPVLSFSISQCLHHNGKHGDTVASLHRSKNERTALLEMASKLYVLGYPLDWRKLNPVGKRVGLPSYPWQRESHWAETEESRQDRIGPAGDLFTGER